jgi:hypothetical protein
MPSAAPGDSRHWAASRCGSSRGPGSGDCRGSWTWPDGILRGGGPERQSHSLVSTDARGGQALVLVNRMSRPFPPLTEPMHAEARRRKTRRGGIGVIAHHLVPAGPSEPGERHPYVGIGVSDRCVRGRSISNTPGSVWKMGPGNKGTPPRLSCSLSASACIGHKREGRREKREVAHSEAP